MSGRRYQLPMAARDPLPARRSEAAERDALAAALAHSAGTLERYKQCSVDPEQDQVEGLYSGYQHAAKLMLQQLKNEGFELKPIEHSEATEAA